MSQDRGTYQLAYADNSTDLCDMVTSMMLEGWTPQGGVAVNVERLSDGSLGYFYYQAMVRPAEGARSAE